MIIWNIEHEDMEWELGVGNTTILKGSHGLWYKLVRLIDDFFQNKSSDVKIYEDNQLIHKKYWECIFIPFDADLQLNKINAKSPLKPVLEEVCNELSLSPIYHELLDLWMDFKEEVELVGNNVKKQGIEVTLKPFEQENLKEFISFYSSNKTMTPIQYKQLFLSLFADRVVEKKKLIIIELPEIYSEEEEFIKFIAKIEQLSNKGIHFIIVTQKNIKGSTNYLLENQIVNMARLEKIKRKVINEVPFFCEEELYLEAKTLFLQAVDNSGYIPQNLDLESNYNKMINVIMLVMAYHLNIKLNIDISNYPQNLKKFINSYIT